MNLQVPTIPGDAAGTHTRGVMVSHSNYTRGSRTLSPRAPFSSSSSLAVLFRGWDSWDCQAGTAWLTQRKAERPLPSHSDKEEKIWSEYVCVHPLEVAFIKSSKGGRIFSALSLGFPCVKSYQIWKQFNWDEMLRNRILILGLYNLQWQPEKFAFPSFCRTGTEVTEVRSLQGWEERDEQMNKTGPDLSSAHLPTPWANNDNPWDTGKTF